MPLKRLVWDFAIHGGAVGVHNLGQGSSYEGQLLWTNRLGIYMFVVPVGNTDVDVGTIDDPQALRSGDDFTSYPAGLSGSNLPTWEFVSSSPWAIRINGSPFTAGVVELLFWSNRR